jgi:hypothetical protein
LLPSSPSSLQGRTESAEALKVARAQLARRRRQLGELTPEQEIAIENLIVSTTAKIAGRIREAQLVIAHKLSAN